MKTILVPTDFSDVAQNAIDYSIEIAKLSKAKLVLFNVFNMPLLTAPGSTIITSSDMEKHAMEGLKKIEKAIYHKHGNNLKVECKSSKGFPVDEIKYFTEEHDTDLIVMGMQGTDYLTEKLLGNITTSLINIVKCPVLVIDKKVKFKGIKRIAFASDLKELHNKSIYESVKHFTTMFNAELMVLQVVPNYHTVPSVTETISSIELDHSLLGVNYTFHHTVNNDVVDGINEFIKEKEIDMLIMIPGIHSAIRRLLMEPETKRMAFHTKVSLLALHE